MRTLLLLLLGSLLYVSAAAQSATDAPESLTVEVFSARTVHAVTVTPIGNAGSMQSCEKCPALSVVAPFSVNVASSRLELSSGAHATRLHLNGSFRIKIPKTESTAAAAGMWTIEPHAGGLRVLLTMPSERYLAAALNGEASPDEPVESLKAMAVAMRTFAIENSRRHASEGFNLCDSTHCQSLRIGTSRAEVERAVLETAGETLWFNRQRAAVYYSQNCGGTTEDVRNEWPSIRASYLTHIQTRIAYVTRMLHGTRSFLSINSTSYLESRAGTRQTTSIPSASASALPVAGRLRCR